MNRHVEGLRALADAIEAANLSGIAYPDQAMNTSLSFRTQVACDEAVEALVNQGGWVAESHRSAGIPVMEVTFARHRHDGSGFGGARVTLFVHDDGVTAE